MYTYFTTMVYQVFNLLFIIAWMTGALIIIHQFFQEFRGREYENGYNETESFRNWKAIRYQKIRKGFRLLTIGIGLQISVIIIKYLIHVFIR